MDKWINGVDVNLPQSSRLYRRTLQRLKWLWKTTHHGGASTCAESDTSAQTWSHFPPLPSSVDAKEDADDEWSSGDGKQCSKGYDEKKWPSGLRRCTSGRRKDEDGFS